MPWVIRGATDRVYRAEIFQTTATCVRDGRPVLYPGTSHGGTHTHRTLSGEVLKFLGEVAA